MLRSIRAELCGPRFKAEVGETVDTKINWIRNLKSINQTSLW